MIASNLNRLPRRAATAALAAAALALLTGAAPAKPAGPRWSAKVTTSAIGAHSFGNPAARIKLREYFSYTCSHCADFEAQAAAALKTLYVDKGLVQIEYRNLVRDPVDMTAALLARCGGAKSFAGNHRAIFAAQPQWLAKVAQASDAQRTSWFQGSIGARARRISADSGLSALMAARGYTATQQNACLDDGVAQAELTAMTNIGLNADHILGTPTFFINGREAGVTAWPDLKSRLDLALKQS